MKKIFSNRTIITFLVAIAILACGTAAFASSTASHAHHAGTPDVHGTITAISGTTLTVTTTAKTPVVYTVDASNAMVLGQKGATLADLTTGQKVSVEGTVSGTSVTAQEIIVMPSVTVAHGTLASVSPSSISVTVTPRAGRGHVAGMSTTRTFTINAHTRFFVPGSKDASVSNLTVGDQVMVLGMTDPVTAGVIDAENINDFPASVKSFETDTAHKESISSLKTTLGL